MSDVTRASTEGLVATGRIAVILKHMGPYQYTAGPDYTALPIERTEFLETVLPRYDGGFEAGAHGVMMSFVALNGVPAHADPFLRDITRAKAGPGAIIESDYDGIYELYGGFGYAASPKEAALRGFREGGVHIDLCSLLFLRHLPELVEEGRIGEEELARPGGRDPRRSRTASACSTTRCSAPIPTASGSSSTGPAPGVARARAGLGGAAPADGARPGGAADPDRRRRAPLRARAARRPGPGGLARRLLEPRQPPPRAGDDAARRHPPALAGGDLRARLRLRRRTEGEIAEADGARARARRMSSSSSASRTSGAASRRRSPSRGVPFVQRRLVEAVRRANPEATLVVFVTAGRALHIPREIEEAADALFWTAHTGSFAGEAIADILAGIADPTARLSHGLPIADGITSGFDTRAGALRPAGGAGGRRARRRGGSATTGAPTTSGSGARWPAAYCFGEGYSYTSFALSDWSLDGDAALGLRRDDARPRGVRVTNTGSRAGTETVHLYYQDMVCEERVPRLLDRLGHRQVTLAPGESATVTFTVTPEMLAKYGRDWEAGPAGLARPRPGREPRPALHRPARGPGARRHRALRRRALRAVLHRGAVTMAR